MTDFIVEPSTISGNITIPSSKSQTLRALLFGMMGTGRSVIHHPLPSPDTEAMIHACRLLGAHIECFPQRIEIMGNQGKLKAPDDVIHAGNSGIVLRFIAALACLSDKYTVITGDPSIRSNRPIQPLLDGLTQLHAFAVSTRMNGYAPVVVKGPLKAGKATISGEDSQPVSALLIASAFSEGAVEVEVRNPGEKPWVGLTLSWFDRLGISYAQRDFEYYRIQGRQSYSGFEYCVPGDMSSAAFALVAAVITKSELTLHNIDMADPQGDKALIHVLQQMGASIEIDEIAKKIHVRKSSQPLVGRKLDINNYIDAIAALAVVGCFAEGTTHLTNASVARTKECDRIRCLTTELRKMGADIVELEDGMLIRSSRICGAKLNAHRDHRLAMALSVAALAAKGSSRVEGVDCVLKTYPSFQKDLNGLGAQIKDWACTI